MARAERKRNSQYEVEVGYHCPECDCVFIKGSETTEIAASRATEDAIYLDGYYYIHADVEDGYELWKCEDGCFNTGDFPEYHELWVCGDCDSYYISRTDAAECC